jgi:hypothetical protein
MDVEIVVIETVGMSDDDRKNKPLVVARRTRKSDGKYVAIGSVDAGSSNPDAAVHARSRCGFVRVCSDCEAGERFKRAGPRPRSIQHAMSFLRDRTSKNFPHPYVYCVSTVLVP